MFENLTTLPLDFGVAIRARLLDLKASDLLLP